MQERVKKHFLKKKKMLKNIIFNVIPSYVIMVFKHKTGSICLFNNMFQKHTLGFMLVLQIIDLDTIVFEDIIFTLILYETR